MESLSACNWLLKAEGVTAGIPDLCVPAWGLWVEMKRADGGTVSPAQKTIMTYLCGIGHHCIVGNGFDDARLKVENYRDKCSKN